MRWKPGVVLAPPEAEAAVKIILLSEEAIRLEPEPGPMTIEAQDVEQQYSPFHMLASSLAFCTFSVLYSWATHAKLSFEDLTLEVRWTFADDPHRVGEMRMSLDWPSLPVNRRRAAERAAELCTVHATLMHPPKVIIDLAGDVDPVSSTAAPGAPASSTAA
jgi:uncharacterized OsmC-like protein